MALQKQEQASLLSDYNTSSTYSLAYTEIIANIRFSLDAAQKQPQAIVLASPTSEHEPGLTATNLAIAAAQNGLPALLVDANLQTPHIQQRFGMGQTSGLSDLLASFNKESQQIEQYVRPTFLPELSLLSAGTLSLSSQETSRLLMRHIDEAIQALKAYMAARYPGLSLLILHGTPVLTGLNTSLLAAHADQTYLLITKGQTTRTQARNALRHLERTHTSVAGTILLDV